MNKTIGSDWIGPHYCWASYPLVPSAQASTVVCVGPSVGATPFPRAAPRTLPPPRPPPPPTLHPPTCPHPYLVGVTFNLVNPVTQLTTT